MVPTPTVVTTRTATEMLRSVTAVGKGMRASIVDYMNGLHPDSWVRSSTVAHAIGYSGPGPVKRVRGEMARLAKEGWLERREMDDGRVVHYRRAVAHISQEGSFPPKLRDGA